MLDVIGLLPLPPLAAEALKGSIPSNPYGQLMRILWAVQEILGKPHCPGVAIFFPC